MTPSPAEIRPKKAKILLVEDEGLIAASIAQHLVGSNFDVVGIADCSDDAFEIAAKMKPDLILMDIRINGPLDGIETAAKLLTQYDVPIVFLSAYSNSQTRARAKLTNANIFLNKPVARNTLIASVELALSTGSANRSNVH